MRVYSAEAPVFTNLCCHELEHTEEGHVFCISEGIFDAGNGQSIGQLCDAVHSIDLWLLHDAWPGPAISVG